VGKYSKLSGKRYWDVLIANNDIDARLFSPQDNHEVQKKLFEKYVSTVGIETDAYCNRICSYCPNSFFDRRSGFKPMDMVRFRKILADLKEVSFDGRVTLNLFNEPLANKNIIEYIQITRQELPKVRISTNTNGDYLNDDYLRQLAAAGMDDLYVTLQVEPNKGYNDEDRLEHLIKFYQRQKTTPKVRLFESGKRIETRYDAHGITVEVFCRNFDTPELGNSRAGKIKSLNIPKRTWPCLRPFREISIANTGNVFPCCQFPPELPSYQDYFSGSAGKESTLFEIYTGKMFSSFRKSLFLFSPKSDVCGICSERICTIDNHDQKLREQIAADMLEATGQKLT
jgi:MoaA/NifB/PqqE/SkfB family radical SAM enzyme